MEFTVEKIENKVVLKLNNYNSFLTVRLNWMIQNLTHCYSSEIAWHIVDTIEKSHAKKIILGNNQCLELTHMNKENIEELLDQLNAILIMGKLVG